MDTNLYTVTISPMIKSLKNMSAMLEKVSAAAQAKASAWQPAEVFETALLNDRLVFDQFPLIQQVQIACDNAKGGAARFAGIEVPKHADTEKTVAELKTRIAKTVAFIESIKPEQVIGQEARPVKLPYFEKPMSGFGYATEYLMPNFYFHVVTAYSILRKNGIEVGKADYMGELPFMA